jgi:hypothetical protein
VSVIPGKFMTQFPVTPMSTVDPRSTVTASALCTVLATETRLLNELIAIMQRQREGASCGNLTMVDDSVFATQRVLHTLAEARRRRREIYRMLGAPEDAGARALAATLGSSLAPDLGQALETLMTAASELAQHVEANRVALRKALGHNRVTAQ